MIFQLKNIFNNLRLKKDKLAIVEDEENAIGTRFPTKKEVKKFFKNDKLLYQYSKQVDDILSKVYKNKEEIRLIRYSDYYFTCFFEDNTMISYWISNGNYGVACRGKYKIGKRQILKWEDKQPSRELACYLKKFAEQIIENKEQHNIAIFKDDKLDIFEYNKDIDAFFKVINDNPESIIEITPKISYNIFIIKLKNNTLLEINYLMISGKIMELASNGVIEHDGKVILEWEESSPSALELYRFRNLIEKKELGKKVASHILDTSDLPF